MKTLGVSWPGDSGVGGQMLHGTALWGFGQEKCLFFPLLKSLVSLPPDTTRSAAASSHSNTPPSVPSLSPCLGSKEKLQADPE